MKVAALALTLATLATGCTKHTTMAGGAVVAGGGALLLGMALSAEPACRHDDPVCGVIVQPTATAINAGVGVVGAVGLLAGLALVAAGSKIGEAPPANVHVAAAPVQPPATSTELAAALEDRSQRQVQLAIQIRTIARSGNCSAALATGKQLREIDPALHLRIAVEDAAYARCVDPAAPTQSMDEPAAW